jgi:DMSO/TMAO reductase YedYZ molybdopterin-dependent catalytic subunit
MADRRRFFKQLAGLAAAALSASGNRVSQPTMAWAAVRRRLPKGTQLKTLVNENPQDLDPRDLEIQPLGQFGTMGLSDQAVTLKDWRLACEGPLSRKIRLTYEQVRALPPLERPVLLICPGFFANYGLWKGVSVSGLARRTGLKQGLTYVTVSGPSGPYEKTFRFPWPEASSGKVFLAYQVNGETLPLQHGFPLRLVAEGYYGYEWVKYVERVQFD